MGVFACSLCAEHWGNTHRFAFPLRTTFHLLCLNGSPGHKPHWLSEFFWGPIPPVGVLKVEVLDVGSKPLALHREAGSWEFLLDCRMLYQGGVYDKSMPESFFYVLMWVFSHLPDG